MYITWPSSSSMWWLTCLPHEITHASVPYTYTYWWPLSVICVGKKYDVLNTTATSAMDPFGTWHINHQAQRVLLHQKSMTDCAWPTALQVHPSFFIHTQAACLKTHSQRSVTDELSVYSSLENVWRAQQWNMIMQEQWDLKPTFYYA